MKHRNRFHSSGPVSRSRSTVFVAVVALAATLVADLRSQSTRVWPPGYATRRGEDAMSTPFTVTTTSGPDYRVRNMTTLAAASLPFRSGSVITGLAFRRDGKYGAPYARAANGLLIVRMGAVRDAQHPDASFDKNWVGQPLQVAFLPSPQFSLPDAPPTGGVAPFSLVIPFGLPFTYAGGDLGIDLDYTTTGPMVWRRDAMSVPTGVTNGAYLNIGPGCTGSLGRVPVVWPELDTAVPGQRMRVHLDEAPRPLTPADSLAVALLGNSMLLAGNIPLPVSLASVGLAPNCLLRTNLAATQVVVQSDPNRQFGRAVAEWPLPFALDLVGSVLFAQWLVLDSGVGSPARMTVSNGIAIGLGAPDPQPRSLVGRTIWRYDACGCDLDGGMVAGPEYVAITQFTGTFQ